MTKFASFVRGRRRIATALLLAVAVAGAAAALVPGTADAIPQKAVFSTFYSDATMTVEVGERILLCSGARISWGIITQYQDYYEEPCGEYEDPSDLPGGY